MARTIVFDVNETLLDLGALEPHFERLFGETAVLSQWFSQVLQTALVMTVVGDYRDFGRDGREALGMVAARRGVTLTADEFAAVGQGMLSLPPHPEVPAALARLRDAGLRLAALTNSAQAAAEAQLTNAGLAPYFDEIMSVEMVQTFKPKAAVYQAAAKRLGISTSQMRMVAEHDWDVWGAMAAGCAAAFVARPNMVLGETAVRPDIIGPDLADVAEKIIAHEQ